MTTFNYTNTAVGTEGAVVTVANSAAGGTPFDVVAQFGTAGGRGGGTITYARVGGSEATQDNPAVEGDMAYKFWPVPSLNPTDTTQTAYVRWNIPEAAGATKIAGRFELYLPSFPAGASQAQQRADFRLFGYLGGGRVSMYHSGANYPHYFAPGEGSSSDVTETPHDISVGELSVGELLHIYENDDPSTQMPLDEWVLWQWEMTCQPDRSGTFHMKISSPDGSIVYRDVNIPHTWFLDMRSTIGITEFGFDLAGNGGYDPDHPDRPLVWMPYYMRNFNVNGDGMPGPVSDADSEWHNIVGATSSTLTIHNVSVDMDGRQYRMVATNSQGFADSNPALLTVGLNPSEPPDETGDLPTDVVPDAIAPASDGGHASILELVREFSIATRQAVRLTGKTSIQIVNLNASVPFGQSDADEMYASSTISSQAGEATLSLDSNDLAMSASAEFQVNDVRVAASSWTPPHQLPLPGFRPLPVTRVTHTFTNDHYEGSVEFASPTPGTIVRRS